MFRQYRIGSKKDAIIVNQDKKGIAIGDPGNSIDIPLDIWKQIVRDYGEKE